MFCRKCGSAIPDGSVFCGECGTKVGESGTPQVTYIVKEAKPKPILTSGENVLINVIGVLQIIKFSFCVILYWIGGSTVSSALGYNMQIIQAFRSVLLLVILFFSAFVFFGVMVLFKKKWALIIFDIVQILGIVISFNSMISGNVLSVIDLIIKVVMVVLLHKCIKALSREVQEARRATRKGYGEAN